MRVGLLAALIPCALAQTPSLAPSVNPRGVVNAFTLQPAPSRVGQGGVIHINGLNLGPPGGVKATGAPLPTRLADPEIEVLINNAPAPLFSADPARIVAQVPWETPPGLATVVVRRGELRSRPARIQVEALVPSLATSDDRGFGEIRATPAGARLRFSATGLGATDPRLDSGAAGPADPLVAPRVNVRAYINGLPANAAAAASPERVGEFDVSIDAVAMAEPGDVVELIAGNQAANRTTLGSIARPQVQFLPLAEGTPEIRALSDSDLRGNYAVANAARDENGCYASFVADFGRRALTPVAGCLTSANRNAVTPVVTPAGSPALAALAGPFEGEASNLSSKVVLFNPAQAAARNVDLPAGAANLAGGANGNINAIVPGDPPRTLGIDIQSGEVAELQPAANPGQGGATPNFANLTVDIDGLKTILVRPAQWGPNVFVAVVGDDARKPTRAKVALLNPRGEVLSSYDFPSGWLPLIPPEPQAAAPAPAPGTPTTPPRPGTPTQPAPGTPPQPTQPVQPAQRALPFLADAQSRSLFVLAAGDSAHALLQFQGTELEWRTHPFPEGWYATACTSAVTLFNLDLARRVALLGSRTLETAAKSPCPAEGFLLFDRETQRVTATPLPGAGQLNAATPRDLNDYIFGSNTDPANRGQADTLYVLDGVSAAVFRIDLPQGAASFGALTAIPSMNALAGPATSRNPGDAGFVLFELDRESARLLPAPGDFAAFTMAGIFETTRKLVARGTKTGNTGSQYIVYDLAADDLAIVPNPEGVAFVGQAPVVPASPTEPRPAAPVPLIQNVNLRSNFITTIGYNADRKQIGLIALKVP